MPRTSIVGTYDDISASSQARSWADDGAHAITALLIQRERNDGTYTNVGQL